MRPKDPCRTDASMRQNTPPRRLAAALVAAALVAGAAGCGRYGLVDGASSDQGAVDAPAPPSSDLALLDTGRKLLPCNNPGKPCNAGDPCAVNPICGTDRRCRPQTLLDCSDAYACTTDRCLGNGQCAHELKAGTCLLPVKTATSAADGGAQDATIGPDAGSSGDGGATSALACFKEGDADPSDPCMVCRSGSPGDGGAAADPRRWTPVPAGGACDDRDPCTHTDTCLAGVCKGVAYGAKCEDFLACTDKRCDGHGGCLSPAIRKGWCLIAGVCRADKAMNPDGTCTMCDASASATAWSAASPTCTIDGRCWAKGSPNPAGCGACDPSQSTSWWTVSTTTCCLIERAVYKPGDKHPQWCHTCAPQKSAVAWTLGAGYCHIDGVCRATDYVLDGGCAACKPSQSTSAWTLTNNGCYIDGQCHAQGGLSFDGCSACDTTKSLTQWTKRSGTCNIDGACHAGGAQHASGCASCDPQKSAEQWTVSPGKCLIGGSCVAAGAKEPGGCGTCEPATSQTAYTPGPGKCLIAGKCLASGTKEAGGCGVCDPSKNKNDWTRPAGCAVTHGWSAAHGSGTYSNDAPPVGTDAAGNVYLASTFYGTVNLGGGPLTCTGGPCMLLCSFSPAGAHRWSRAFGGGTSGINQATPVDLAVGPGGHVTVVGEFRGMLTFGSGPLPWEHDYDAFVASFDAKGQHRWSYGFGGKQNDNARSVAAGPAGVVYVMGRAGASNPISFGGPKVSGNGTDDLYLASYTALGAHRWSKRISGGSHQGSGGGLATDGAGNLYVGGAFGGTAVMGGQQVKAAGQSDAYVVAYTSLGVERWYRVLGGKDSDAVSAVAADAAGNVVVSGVFKQSADFGGGLVTGGTEKTMIVASYAGATGKHNWSRAFGSVNPGDTHWGRTVDVDAKGNVYVAGTFSKSVSFGSTTLAVTEQDSVFAASFDAKGTLRWLRGPKGLGARTGPDFAVGPGGAVWLSGYLDGPLDFGGGTLTYSGKYGIYLVKWEQ